MTNILYGEETRKAVENFRISSRTVNLQLIYAVAEVKWAAAKANLKVGKLDKKIADAICQACDEIIAGKHDDQFVTDAIQGGAGTSINMNVNEVVASRANQLLHQPNFVHPLDHVNLSQSTNDVIPTAIRLSWLRLIDKYIEALNQLVKVINKRAKEHQNTIKVGRTHLQDAVPMTLGQEFGAYAAVVARDAKRLSAGKTELLTTNLGGTAIGTKILSSSEFVKLANQFLATKTGFDFKPAANLIDATQNIDPLLYVQYTLQLSAVNLSKIACDLRLLNSGPKAGLGEITLQALQKGSTIMPGKVNPVIPEMINQVTHRVMGLTTLATMTGYSAQLELNVMLPTFIDAALETVMILTNAVKTFAISFANLQVNVERCRQLFENSDCVATTFEHVLGYDKTAELVKKAQANGTSFLSELKATQLIDNLTIEKYIDNLIKSLHTN